MFNKSKQQKQTNGMRPFIDETQFAVIYNYCHIIQHNKK